MATKSPDSAWKRIGKQLGFLSGRMSSLEGRLDELERPQDLDQIEKDLIEGIKEGEAEAKKATKK